MLVKTRFDLDDETAEQLIEQAAEAENEAVDLFRFTSVLMRKLDEEGRLRFVEMMWQMIYADGRVTEFEENLIWRVADLLGISSRQRIRCANASPRKERRRMTTPVTIITGASAGIGTELARVFAKNGHALVLVARREDRLKALAAEIAASGAPSRWCSARPRAAGCGGRILRRRWRRAISSRNTSSTTPASD